MTANERTLQDVSDTPQEASAEVHEVLQRWVVERMSRLKTRTLELGAAPKAIFQRAVIPPKQILRAANPRQLIRTLSDTGAQLGTRLTSLARTDRSAETPAASTEPAVDKLKTYWKARFDVLQKMIEKKPSL